MLNLIFASSYSRIFPFESLNLRPISASDFKKAILILKYFEENPKACPIIPMVALIYTLFIKIIHIHMSKDKSKQTLSEILKINPYFLNQYLLAAKKYPPQIKSHS